MKRATQHTEPARKRPRVALHKQGDPEFSPVAILNRHGPDLREWQTGSCRCLKCEIVSASPKMSGCECIVLLDIDNWGYAPLSLTEAGNIGSNVFVWCFHGLGFEKHHRTDLGQVDWTRHVPPRAGAKRCKPPRRSYFAALSQSGRLHFSPCAGSDQAADEAILAALPAVRCRRIPVALVTADKGLIASAQERSATQDLANTGPALGPLLTVMPESSAETTWSSVLGAAGLR
eukprot:NODE_3716_length_860_cov_59.229195_g3693_i0.p1 GENE.NODE_3716_length_860_cov_59.229195_g3693_i0~~NODE_3716_length_860_cov_59.229195_g3693_i0.p1  ORF type:complete len:232 (-),score=7.65 NODE_3716_length_860_cov_59.229195_g3693_i0:45-740(-)